MPDILSSGRSPIRRRPWLAIPLILLVALILAAGGVLRLWFIHRHPHVEGDSLLYGDIAKNWLTHGVYGLTITGNFGPAIEPTLIRLPGYPAFLALCFSVFGLEHYRAVLYLQAGVDLLSCLLIAGFVLRICGSRAALTALLLAALCPFTANYTAAALTETLSIFCVALGFYSLAEFATSPRLFWLAPLSFSCCYATLLRPDGALLAAVLFFAFIREGRSSLGLTRSIRLALFCACFSALPFAAWGFRNLRTFHVIQPLVPRSATDPYEFAAQGFNRWVKTWAIDFTSTAEFYWNADSDSLDVGLLPSRAFDTPAQYRQTRDLLSDYNAITTVTPLLDARFASLAEKRIRLHPVRYYAVLPVLRVADMWLYPRIELLDIPLHWWRYSQHPQESRFAILYGALNMGYLIAALVGVFRWPRQARPILAAMIALILLRSLLLATIEAPEPRYTMECFPLVIALAAAGVAGARRRREIKPAPIPIP